MVKFAPLTATQVLEAVSGTIVADRRASGERLAVCQLAEPLGAGPEAVAFVISEIFVRDVAKTGAAILVVQAAFAERVLNDLPPGVRLCLSCPDAYLALASLSRRIAESDPFVEWRIPNAAERVPEHIHAAARIDESARLGPGVVVGEGARIGARTQILANVVVGPEVAIGSDCVIFPGVVFYPRTQVGDRVRVHANVVVGSDGFGYARGPKGSVKIWHLGRVVIGDDVEIGAGTMVDRGTMKDTIIEQGAKIDNLVQIGHNGHVKAHAILCAQVGMAGNVTVGQGAILAGKVGVADKIEIGDGAVVGPMTGLSKDVKPGDQVMGHHVAKPRREWWRLLALFDRLPELYERVKKLEGKTQ